MRRLWLGLVGLALPAALAAQTGKGPYARIAVLRPFDGKTEKFEAGYLRHLEWHRRAGDPWTWYGWTVWAGDRYRWFVYATFNRSAGSLDSAVTPAEDERDNLRNVVPHAEFVANALYRYLPELSRGTGEPQPGPRLEYTRVELIPGAAAAFEAALRAAQPELEGETLWYRMAVGGEMPRYLRLRPRSGLGALLQEPRELSLPDAAVPLVARVTTEIWTLRPTMSYRLP
jgi:hypothetical protein